MTTPNRLTPEQHAAITTRDVSVALDAGAGCGKTFVLTERFLSHLTPPTETSPAASSAEGPRAQQGPPAELHELIAITFTEAAAREMRDRIRRACRDRLRAAVGPAGDYWLALLRSIDSARVHTIHGFCGALVRTHAVELGIDPVFQVLDAGAADLLRSEVTDESLRQRLTARDPLAMDLAATLDLPGLKQRLWGLLEHAGTPGFDAWLGRPAAAAVAAWAEAYETVYLPAMGRLVAELAELRVVRELLPLASPTSPRFSDARDALLGAVERFEAGGATPADFASLLRFARVKGVCGAKDWPDADAYQRYKTACEKVRKQAEKLLPPADGADAERAARLGLDLMTLAGGVAEDYAEAKRTRGVLDFDDLLLQARRLLTEPALEAARRRLQQQVRLLMVDEFQDTNRTQADIVKAIVGSGVADGRLFFVGDFKQSIYRFRGAEPRVFRELQDQTPTRGRLPLSTNFRSQPAVIDFVNTLFAPRFGAAYTPLRAARPQTTDAPAVEFLWAPVEARASAIACRQAEASGIARRVRELIESRAPIAARRDASGGWAPAPVTPGDVAILFRALSDVRHYEQALRDEGIKHFLVGGHAFYTQQEVFDVANLLRAVSSQSDEVALAGVLRSPFFSLLDETLFWLAESSGGLAAGFAQAGVPPALSAEEAAKVTCARSTLHRLRQRKGRAAVADVLVEAIQQTGYDAVLVSEFLGERKLANLHKLIDQARSHDAYRPGDLDGFVRQLAEFVARQPKEALAATRSGAADEVRLMTVHAAKGLEFPVVVLADLDRPARPETSPVGFSETLGPLVRSDRDQADRAYGIDTRRVAEAADDQAERQRLFYVACTRAADYLILSAARDPQQPPKGEPLRMLSAEFDLATGDTKRTVDAKGADGARHAPLVRVTTADGRSPSAASPAGVKRMDLLASAAAAAGRAEPPASVRPIPIRGDAIQRFSVSRLTGQLQQTSPRPAAVGLAAALSGAGDGVDPRGLGTLTHAALELLDLKRGADQPIGEWCHALAPRHVARNWRRAADDAAELILRFVASDRFALLRRATRVDREVEFLLPWPQGRGASSGLATGQATGGTYLQGYIDCLAYDRDGTATVLDFKTNRVDADGVSQAAEPYRLQLAVYAMAVEAATGRPPRELCLHFLRPSAEACFAWDEVARAGARRLVDQAIAGVRAEAALAAVQASMLYDWSPAATPHS